MQHLIANLVLALAAAEGDFEGAEQGFRADGTFEEKDVAERLTPFAESFALGGDAAADSEKDEGKVGPGRLLLDNSTQLCDGAAGKRFFREDDGASAALNSVSRLAWLRLVRETFASDRIGWALWGYDDVMGFNIARPPSNTLRESSLPRLMLWDHSNIFM